MNDTSGRPQGFLRTRVLGLFGGTRCRIGPCLGDPLAQRPRPWRPEAFEL